MKTYKFLLLSLLTCTLLYTSCSKYGNELSYVETGTLVVKLTDAPFPFDYVSEANVTIFKIEARLKGSSDSESEFFTLYEEDMTVNLLELKNGITSTITTVEVPVGSYDLIRVFVRDGSVILSNETTYDLKIPSGDQSGIKVFVNPSLEIVSEISSELLLDFDVSSSFVPKGSTATIDGITGFNFKPVIRAANLSFAGSLSGLVTNVTDGVVTPIEGVQIDVLENGSLITTTFTDETGNYTVLGLVAGTYTIIAEGMEYEISTEEQVEITAANKTNLDFVLLAK